MPWGGMAHTRLAWPHNTTANTKHNYTLLLYG